MPRRGELYLAPDMDARPALTLRTSWLSEFRLPDGALAMFEVAGDCTTFGILCAALAQVPGVEFAERPPARFSGPARFRFKGHDFTVSMEHDDYRVTTLTPDTSPSAEELLNHVRSLVRPRRPRTSSSSSHA
jgi:hypothetical protein